MTMRSCCVFLLPLHFPLENLLLLLERVLVVDFLSQFKANFYMVMMGDGNCGDFRGGF